ncbi:MAG: cyclic pyranopterin monophosphate synthase MoaC [Siphonobacter sp.]
MSFSHIDKNANPTMVDVSDKHITRRTAIARSIVVLPEVVLRALQDGEIRTKKGPVFHTAIIAGTMGAKKTSDLIPFCHPLGLDSCTFKIDIHHGNEVHIECTCVLEAKTGVEMEALTGASVAALTIYDMCKALSHDIVIKDTQLILKTGGKSDVKKV